MALNFESSCLHLPNAEVQACSTRHHTFSFCRGHFSRSELAWKLRALFLVGTELLPQVHWGVCESGVHLLLSTRLSTVIQDYHQLPYLQWSATITNFLTYHHTLSTAVNLKKNQIPKLFVKVYMTPLSKVSQSFPIPKRKKKSQNNCWLDRGDRQLCSACAYAGC